MKDVFEHTILCENCNLKMQKAQVIKNGFLLRAVVCPKCNDKIIHPQDQAEYEKYTGLRNKVFKVKLRIVGNSYAVSIPKEIVSFIKDQEQVFNDMVRLCFEQGNKLSLSFGDEFEKQND